MEVLGWDAGLHGGDRSQRTLPRPVRGGGGGQSTQTPDGQARPLLSICGQVALVFLSAGPAWHVEKLRPGGL